MNESILGNHAVYTIQSNSANKLKDIAFWKEFINQKFAGYQLTILGKVDHQFPNAGFTSVYCLSESHIAIHTWPEIQTVTFDVYLCNYSKNNDALVKKLAEEITAFFEGKIITHQIIQR